MAEVQVQRRSLVVPAKPTQRESLYLSCLDIFWQDVHYNERLIFYQCPGVSGQQDGMLSGQLTGAAPLMQKLQSSLALCLVEYYPWCGRIAKSADPPHRLFIDCSDADADADADAGVEFVEASVPLPLSLLAHNGFQMNPFFEQLCQHPDHRGDSLFSSPLLSIQATLFSDGGLALGIAQSHIVADGQSLWNFLVSWGECARGMPLTVVPLHTREKLALPNPPPMPADSNFNFEVQDADICDSYDELADNANTSVSMNKCLANDGNIDGEEQCTPLCKEMGSHPHGGSSGISGINPHITIIPMSDMGMNMLPLEADSLVSGADSLVQCVVTLSDLAIRKLKHEAHGAYTSYEVMCAHFWQRVTIARGGPQNEPTFFSVFANGRSHSSPPLPPAYFGNVIMFAVASDTVGKLSSEGLSSIADRIHNAKATCDENSLMGFMHWLELNDNHMAFAINPVSGQMVFMASSPRFPAYQVDFGWGRPDAVRSVKVHGDGELVIFGGQSGLGHGGVEICLALPANVMKRLLEDRQFLAQLPKGTSKMSTTVDKISTS